MQKARSWQDSFDRLEAVRRDERQMHDAEEQQVRDAEAAYARAVAMEAEKPAAPGFMLGSENADSGEALTKPKKLAKPEKLASPKPPASPKKLAKPKQRAKSGTRKSASRKPAAPRRVAAKAKPPVAKSRPAKPRKSAPRRKPANAALPPAIALPSEIPAAPAEQLLITPLPRSASLAPYRKTGLFGLIGSWLRIATRQATSGLAGSVRRPNMKPKARKPAGQFRAPFDEVAELRDENARLRSQLEALLALQEKAVT